MSDIMRKMPLEDCGINHDGLTVRPVPHRGKILLQRSNMVTDREMSVFGQKFAETFGPELPLEVCRRSVGNDGDITVLCLNPNSWIILGDDQDVGSITEWITTAAQAATIITSEITDQYICLAIEGCHGRALLAKGCALDLSGDVLTVKNVASTLLAQANIMIWRHGKDSFRILFDVSLSDYLWHWLEGAAAEFEINRS